MSSNDTTKLEFLLTLSGNIICQRFFNVRNYNPRVKRSLDLHYEVKNICEEIQEDLKQKTLEFLHENPNYFPVSGVNNDEGQEVKENFQLEIKQNDEVFISRIFPAYIYHPKVRYSVDIRPKLRRFLGDLSETLSSTKLMTKYMNYELSK
jgi:hypothetical protein|tara:strand:- start:5262 stop:5711 length:450 start_codon:yes stop_codon:yes gene_type:complete